MGFERKFTQAFLCITLAAATGVAAAPPGGEWTPLPDADPVFQPLPDPGAEPGLDPRQDAAIDRFSMAVAESVRQEQQAIRAACRSLGSGELQKADWGSKVQCHYNRH